MTTAYVATMGGHISELVELAQRIPDNDDALWITNDSAQTRDLLRGRRVEMVPFIAERDVAGVARALPQARKLLRKHGATRVISTGSAIALAYLPVAAALGLKSHYIESSTRVRASSSTGSLLSRLPGVRCWWQFQPSADRFVYLGGVYDRYGASDCGQTATDLNRVVVTVGTTDRDFRRCIKRLVEVLPDSAEVLWQTGHSDVSGLGIDAHRMVPESVLVEAIDNADVVVTHAGAGSLALSLQAGKVPVFVPRRAQFGEQIDDHQVELAQWADEQRLAIWAEADELSLAHLYAAAGRLVESHHVGKLVLP